MEAMAVPPIPKTELAKVEKNICPLNDILKYPVKYKITMQGIIKNTNANVAICKEVAPFKYFPTMFTLMPYKAVANKIKDENEMFLKSILPLPAKSKINPVKPIIIPIIFLSPAFNSKKITPIIIVKKVVNAFSIPASELSIFVSARQNKYAGKKLPSSPESITNPIFFLGIALNAFQVNGIKTIPALKILMVATWYAVKATRPSFINTNELPQIKERIIKSSQLMKLFFKFF